MILEHNHFCFQKHFEFQYAMSKEEAVICMVQKDVLLMERAASVDQVILEKIAATVHQMN